MRGSGHSYGAGGGAGGGAWGAGRGGGASWQGSMPGLPGAAPTQRTVISNKLALYPPTRIHQ